jgi:LmbE family N-acetylglucosaminyl deacetylase
MPDRVSGVSRRAVLRRSLLCSALFGTHWRPSLLAAADEVAEPFLERAAAGKPHQGKVLLAVQAHSDDIPLLCPGVVAKLVNEGYTGYLVRTTNDDMGDAPGLGTPGTVGDNVLANERDNAEVARVLGLKKAFDLNYPNHRMGDVPLNELICRLIFLIRLLRVDTVVSFNPWARYEENPDHHQTARGVEAACWMAGRKHDYPEQLEAGLEVKTVQERYYFARNATRPDVNRVVDVSDYVEQMIDCNRANRAKGPAGTHGSQLRADLEKRGLRLPLLGSDDETADRKFIEHFTLAGSRELGKKYGVKYAEAFHHIGGQTKADPVAEYVRENAEPIGK